MPGKRPKKDYLPYCFALILCLIIGGTLLFGCTSSASKRNTTTNMTQSDQAKSEKRSDEKNTTEKIAQKVAEAPIGIPEEKPQPSVQSIDPSTLTPKQGVVYSVLIDKSDFTLILLEAGKPLHTFRVAIGKNHGQKQAVGDLRTPTGDFTVDEIDDASYWTHDFGDGKGVIAGAYGPWFISLETPGWSGIGIHGTHDPSSIGTCVSEGCVRMNNNELRILKKFVHVGTEVRIQE